MKSQLPLIPHTKINWKCVLYPRVKLYKLLEDTIGGKSVWPRPLIRQRVHTCDTKKCLTHKNDQFNLQSKTLLSWKVPLREWQGINSEYLQIAYLIKNLYPESMKNSHNSIKENM